MPDATLLCEHHWSRHRYEPELEREMRYCMRCGRCQQREGHGCNRFAKWRNNRLRAGRHIKLFSYVVDEAD